MNPSLLPKKGEVPPTGSAYVGHRFTGKGLPALRSTDGICGLRYGAERDKKTMRKQSTDVHGTRLSALWGSSSGGRGGEHRSNALWGRGGRNAAFLLVLSLAAVICLPAAAVAGGGNGSPKGAVVPASLIEAAQANPDQVFHVIVQGTKGNKSDAVAQEVNAEQGKLKLKFFSIGGVSADLSGKDLLKLAQHPNVLAITPDAPVKTSAYQNSEMWRLSADVASLWNTTDPVTGLVTGPAPNAPAVAIVDSGVDASKIGDFGSALDQPASSDQ